MTKIIPLPLRMSSAYLLENRNGLYLVDAGSPGDERRIMKSIQQRGKPLRIIFITHAHFDHYGAAAAIRRQTGASIAIHSADVQAMAEGKTPIRMARGRGRLTHALMPLFEPWMPKIPTRTDLPMQDGDRLDSFGLDAALLHTPGHTPGSSCLIIDKTLAFAGDLVIANQRPHVQRFYADDWSQITTSLARLQALNPELVYTGHGIKPINADTLQKLRKSSM
jgi:glyoxylase-like metal-dependent hydrolase (beta-lactamase superfamily II)